MPRASIVFSAMRPSLTGSRNDSENKSVLFMRRSAPARLTRNRNSWLAALSLAGALMAGCSSSPSNPSPLGGPSPSPSPGPAPLPTQATSADLAYCVSETNRDRAIVGKPALHESASLESFAAAAAQSDAQSRSPHGYAKTHASGTWAENEIPWWPLASYGTVQAVMTQGIAQMWAEGPTGGHYQNIVGPYSQLGCGVYIGNGEITVAMDFR